MQKIDPGEPLLAEETYSNLPHAVLDDLRWAVAMDIVRHCALVTATVDGEDSAGRQRLRLLTAEEVADRALDIAENMVEGAIEREWLCKRTLSREEQARNIGKLERIRMRAEMHAPEATPNP